MVESTGEDWSNELGDRLRQLRAVFEDVAQRDVQDAHASQVQETATARVAVFDLRDGRSDALIARDAAGLTFLLASFGAYIVNWAIQNGHHKDQAKARVEKAVGESRALRILIDLANRDKHPGKGRDGGRSGLHPRVGFVTRQVSAPPGAGFTVTADGKFTPAGKPGAVIAANAPIHARNGDFLGHLNSLHSEALDAWESLMDEYGSTERRRRNRKKKTPTRLAGTAIRVRVRKAPECMYSL